MLRVLGRSSSHNVQKVMWCLAELGLPSERVDVGGKFGGNRDAGYLQLNPNGVVPTLVDGAVVVWESNTILRYLCNQNPSGLYPRDAMQRSQVERWMDWQLGTLSRSIVPLYQAIVRTPLDRRDAAKIEEHRLATTGLLSLLDDALRSRPYLASNDLTLADVCLGPSVYRWFALPIQREEMPALRRWYEELAKRATYQAHVMLPLS